MHAAIGILTMLLAIAPARAERTFTITVDGAPRSYIIHAPKAKTSERYPLVVLMHGGGGNATQAMNAYRMNEVADREGFLVAYPNGSGRRQGRLLTWNAGNCCAYAMEHEIDDVAFIRAMIEKIDRDYGIDRSRIYATGMSNGAMMSYRLGCEAADLFAAIGPVAGALNISCQPSDEVSVVIFHGTDDQHVPYEGGEGPKSLAPRTDTPVSHAVDTWRAIDGCSREVRETTRGSVTRSGWAGCREGTDVLLYTIEGGGHAWPGGVPPRRNIADPPTQEISASEEIWKFFASHPKR